MATAKNMHLEKLVLCGTHNIRYVILTASNSNISLLINDSQSSRKFKKNREMITELN